MYRVKMSALIIATACLLSSVSVQAGVRNFFSPRVLGDKIAFCSADNELCGKPVADAWCAHKGFSKALLFQRDRSKSSEVNVFVRFADTGRVCDGASKDGSKNMQCVSFRQIKCISG